MLEVSSVIKKTPFKLTDGKKSVSLEITQFNIGDSQRLYDLQKGFFDEEGTFIAKNLNRLTISRVITSVKLPKGGYHWATIDAFIAGEYPQDMLAMLSEEVEKINPLATKKATAKKK